MSVEDRGTVMEVDVVVIGSGAAGMTTAIVAADAGLSVCVVEKSAVFGGTTAYSGGGLNIPNHHIAPDICPPDDLDTVRGYYRSVLGNYYDATKVDAFLDAAPDMLKYIEAHSDVRFAWFPTPDYEPWFDGANESRQVFADAFDGRKLGDKLKLLRQPWPQLGLFGDMQIRAWEVPTFLNTFKTFKAFRAGATLTVRHVLQKLVHGRGTRLCMGNALAGGLFKAMLDRDITLWNEARAMSLIVDNGAVRGIVVRRGTADETILARRGVVLAGGGFAANPEMSADYFPPEQGPTLAAESTQGDGMKMAIAVGGKFVDSNAHNGIWVPMSTRRSADGTLVHFPHLVLDRYNAGTLVVDPSGRRFINEGCNYQIFCDVMHQQKMTEAYIVAGHDFVRRKGLGMARPAPLSLRPYLKSGYLVRGRTIAELADKLGVDAGTLTATVKTFDGYARTGKDVEFRRGEDFYSARKGDGTTFPNPTMAPIGEGPYYALKIRPGNLGSVCGLDTNASAQVLDEKGSIIAGLYAVGTNANSIFRGAYPTGGSSLGPAMTFAYIAARHIAGRQG